MTEMLSRSVPYEMRAADEGDGLTLEGYGAVFNSPTRIDSWEGTFDEEIAPGAFKRSLAARTPVLQFDHGKHPYVGSIPIGSFESIREDDHGLHIVARLHDNDLVKPVRQAIESRAISGMSFRFQVVKEAWRTADGKQVKPSDVDRMLMRTDRNDPATILRRSLLDMELFESGPVVFPAYGDTSVGVRSQELAALLSDPQIRAEAARLLVAAAPSDDEGSSGEERIAPSVPSPAARDRALRLEREIR